MPSINFMERFAGMVERGEKLQTIRKLRKRPIVVGDTLQLYTGQRSALCRLLGKARCAGVTAIRISEPGERGAPWGVQVEERALSSPEIVKLAQDDGFPASAEFIMFFIDHYGLPFEGVLIEWELEGNGDG